MKKIIFLSFLLSGFFCNAQTSVAVKSIGDLRSKNQLPQTLAKSSANSDKPFIAVSGYYHPNDGGGGQFFFDDTSTVADNGGTIIKPASVTGAGRWKRIFSREVNVLWFGAKADNLFDNRAIFQAAFDAAGGLSNTYYTKNQDKGTVYIPGQSLYYFISDSIRINHSLSIRGDYGHTPIYPSRILVASGKPGLIIRFNPSTGTGAFYCKIENLELQKDNPYADKSLTSGIWTNTRVHLSNVSVRYFSGNGIEINTQYNGNSNSSIIENCQVVGNRKNGLFLRGMESNNLNITDLFTASNGYFGVDDSSFLGNNYFNLHTEANGHRSDVTDNSTLVNGLYYWCIKDNVGIQPGVTSGWETYWIKSSFGTWGKNWDVKRQYKAAGAYRSEGTVQYSTFNGCYTEGDEAPGQHGAGSIWMSGNSGAGFINKYVPRFSVAQQQLYFYGKGLVVTDDQNIGQNNGNTYTRLDIDNGLTYPYQGGYIHLNRDNATKTVAFYGQETKSNKALEFSYISFPISKFNWRADAGNSPAIPIVSLRLGFRSISDPQRIRMIYADSIPPPSVYNSHGKGDFIINNGSNANIIGWKNTGAEWTVIRSGNAVVLPRMTKAQRNAIRSPETGTAIFQTDNTPGLRVYNGSNWVRYSETAD